MHALARALPAAGTAARLWRPGKTRWPRPIACTSSAACRSICRWSRRPGGTIARGAVHHGLVRAWPIASARPADDPRIWPLGALAGPDGLPALALLAAPALCGGRPAAAQFQRRSPAIDALFPRAGGTDAHRSQRGLPQSRAADPEAVRQAGRPARFRPLSGPDRTSQEPLGFLWAMRELMCRWSCWATWCRVANGIWRSAAARPARMCNSSSTSSRRSALGQRLCRLRLPGAGQLVRSAGLRGVGGRHVGHAAGPARGRLRAASISAGRHST